MDTSGGHGPVRGLQIQVPAPAFLPGLLMSQGPVLACGFFQTKRLQLIPSVGLTSLDNRPRAFLLPLNKPAKNQRPQLGLGALAPPPGWLRGSRARSGCGSTISGTGRAGGRFPPTSTARRSLRGTFHGGSHFWVPAPLCTRKCLCRWGLLCLFPRGLSVTLFPPGHRRQFTPPPGDEAQSVAGTGREGLSTPPQSSLHPGVRGLTPLSHTDTQTT